MHAYTVLETNDISCEIRRSRWNSLGHAFRREDVNDCLTALGWTPEGRRARGRPKTTWRMTAERERHQRSGVEELEHVQDSGTEQRVLVRQRGGLMHLMAQREEMMMMMMMMMMMILFSFMSVLQI